MWPFRYLGQQHKIMRIYACFAETPRQALHPAQVSRKTGLSLSSVNERLEHTPELFVKIPKRSDGLTRYRLTSPVQALSESQVEARVRRAVRTEQLTLYTVLLMTISLIAVAMVVGFPWWMLMPD